MGRTWFAGDQMSPGSSEQEQYVRLRIFKCFVMVSHVASRVLREGSRAEKVAQWGRVITYYANMTVPM